MNTTKIAPSLTIVIPALNEEEAIGSTIQRCLDARVPIMDQSQIAHVEIIVVSDGSTDRTAEIAQSFEEVSVIVFPSNKGYGAAIKAGFAQGTGSLVGFLDADGTCDPIYFGKMCAVALEEHAHVVLGSRLGPGSQMPAIRRLGNQIYALLLGALSGSHVTDTASGMRVIHRNALDYLYPLPDGLHFTPSMSARALLNGLNVHEIPMTYEERIGESKLSVFRDGIRFLRAIFSSALHYRPESIFLTLAVMFFLLIIILGITPTEFYFQHRSLENWMIYRFVGCSLCASACLTLVLSVALTHKIAFFSRRRKSSLAFWPRLISDCCGLKTIGILAGISAAASLIAIWPGLISYLSTGETTLHWSRLLAGSLGLLSMIQLCVFGILTKLVSLWHFDVISSQNRTSPIHPLQRESATHNSKSSNVITAIHQKTTVPH